MPDEPLTQDPTYAFVANGDVLYTRQFTTPPTDPAYRLVVESDPPASDPVTQDVVQSGWVITDATATHAWTVLQKPDPNATPVLSHPNDLPSVVNLCDFRAAIELAGILPQVEALISGLTGQTKIIVETRWVYGNYIERHHPLIQALGPQLGLTTAQIDDIFRTAAKLA